MNTHCQWFLENFSRLLNKRQLLVNLNHSFSTAIPIYLQWKYLQSRVDSLPLSINNFTVICTIKTSAHLDSNKIRRCLTVHNNIVFGSSEWHIKRIMVPLHWNVCIDIPILELLALDARRRFFWKFATYFVHDIQAKSTNVTFFMV